MNPQEEALKEALAALNDAESRLTQKDAQLEKDRQNLLSRLTKEIAALLNPLFTKLPGLIQKSISDATIKIQVPEQPAPVVNVTVPDVYVPPIQVPKAEVTVTMPPIKVPSIIVPEQKITMPGSMRVDGEVTLKGVSKTYPLPVVLMDPSTGEPLTRFGNNFVTGGGSAGGPRIVGINEILDNTGASVFDNSNHAVKVNIVAGSASGTQYADGAAIGTATGNALELQDGTNFHAAYGGAGVTNPGTLRTVQAVDSVSSVNIVSGSVTLSGNDTNIGPSGANTLRMTMATDSVSSMQSAAQGLNETTAGVLRTVIMTDSVTSVNVVSGSVTLSGNDMNIGPSGANTLRMTVATDSVSSVQSAAQGLNETTAGVLRVVQMSDTVGSSNITTFNGNAPATGLNETTSGVLRVVTMSDTVSSSNITTFNGNAPSVGLNETTNGVLRTVMMSDTVSSSNVVSFNGNTVSTNQGDTSPGTLRIIHAGDAGTSSNIIQLAGTAIAANSGVTGAGTLRVVHAVDVGTSTNAQGDTANASADAGNPVKIGFVGKSANPTRVADGQRVNGLADLAGRQVTTLHQVRELVTDSNVALVRGVETTILTQVASTFLDLVMVTVANASTNAISVKIFESSGGLQRDTIQVPASDYRGKSYVVPMPQTSSAHDWTAQLTGSDISDSNVTVYMQALKNT